MFSIAYGCATAPFLVFGTAEVAIVDRRSLVAILEASDLESSGFRGRTNCDGGIDSRIKHCITASSLSTVP